MPHGGTAAELLPCGLFCAKQLQASPARGSGESGAKRSAISGPLDRARQQPFHNNTRAAPAGRRATPVKARHPAVVYCPPATGGDAPGRRK